MVTLTSMNAYSLIEGNHHHGEFQSLRKRVLKTKQKTAKHSGFHRGWNLINRLLENVLKLLKALCTVSFSFVLQMLLRASDYTFWNWLKSVQLGGMFPSCTVWKLSLQKSDPTMLLHSLNESIIPFNPFTAPVCKIARLKDPHGIFSGAITHLLLMLCVLMKILWHASAKEKRKFHTFIGCFQVASWQ